MFFLKKLLTQVIYPMPFITLFIIITLLLFHFRKGAKLPRYLTGITIVLLMLFSFDLYPQLVAGHLEKKFPALREAPEGVTTVVVLGGGSCADPLLPVSSQLTEASLIRLTEGITQFNRLDSARLIVTGGAVFDTVTIASLQRRMAIQLGVDSNAIAMADSALDTEMEARAVREMVQEDRIILVTSALHMNRAQSLFRNVGFDPVPAPTDHKVKQGVLTPSDFFPSAGNLVILRKAAHEYFGMIWSKLRGKV